jgi:hypothetical protein
MTMRTLFVLFTDARLLIHDLMKVENVRSIKVQEEILCLPLALSIVARNSYHPGNSSEHPPRFGLVAHEGLTRFITAGVRPHSIASVGIVW